MKSFLTVITMALAINGGKGVSAQQQVVWHLDNLEMIGGQAVTVVGEPKIIDTPTGKAMEFDGVDDGIFLDVHPMAGWATFTVEVIFQPYKDGLPEQRFFHMQESESDDRVMFETRLTDDDRWYLDTFVLSRGTGNAMLARDNKHPVGSWYHAACVVDGTSMKHYVNGEFEMGKDFEYSAQKPGKTSLGVRQNLVHWYKGAIRAARFTPSVLSPEEFLKIEKGESRIEN